MRLLLSLICLAAIGCSKRDHSESDTVTPAPPAALEEKHRDYCEFIRPVLDEQHYVGTMCDSAGFTSLHALACDDIEKVDLSVFSDDIGRLHRTADHKACWDYDKTDAENGEAGFRSGYSKDHFLMRMVGAWEQKDLAWVKDYLAFGRAHGWVICNASNPVDFLSRCVASPNLVFQLEQLEKKLAGSAMLPAPADGEPRALPADFEAHLRVLSIWLDGQLYGGITSRQLKDLEGLAEREDRNALYQAVNARFHDGDMTRVFELLGDSAQWPDGHLPSNQENHCTDYLYQRDQLKDGAPNGDWAPCPEEVLNYHPATDYGVALYIARGD